MGAFGGTVTLLGFRASTNIGAKCKKFRVPRWEMALQISLRIYRLFRMRRLEVWLITSVYRQDLKSWLTMTD